MSVRMGSEVEEPSKGRLGASFFLGFRDYCNTRWGKKFSPRRVTARPSRRGSGRGRILPREATLGGTHARATAFYLEYFSELMNQTA